jgi:hypothetical protein
VLVWSAYLCLKESDSRKGVLTSVSIDVQADRQDYEATPVNSNKKFEKMLEKTASEMAGRSYTLPSDNTRHTTNKYANA